MAVLGKNFWTIFGQFLDNFASIPLLRIRKKLLKDRPKIQKNCKNCPKKSQKMSKKIKTFPYTHNGSKNPSLRLTIILQLWVVGVKRGSGDLKKKKKATPPLGGVKAQNVTYISQQSLIRGKKATPPLGGVKAWSGGSGGDQGIIKLSKQLSNKNSKRPHTPIIWARIRRFNWRH